MISDVKKYLFIGVQEDIEIFFKRAQEKGFIEFISESGRKTTDYNEKIQGIISALKVLQGQPKKKAAALTKDLDATELAQNILEHRDALEKYLEEERLLQAEIGRIEPFGNFSIEDLQKIERESHRNIQFFCIRSGIARKTPLSEELIFISSQYDMDYYITISDKIESFPGMIEMHIGKSLEKLRMELELTRKEIKNCEDELKENAAYIDFLTQHLISEINSFTLKFAKSEISNHLNDSLFAIEGWIPKARLHSLFPLLDGLGIHAEEIAIEKEDRVPTYMKNKGFSRAGEDLVYIYDIPATQDKDPSLWVFWAFAIFFAIIISDAGYGLLYLALTFFIKKKYAPLKGSVRRVVQLFTVISCACICWGILAGSYFGIEISPKNPLNKASVIHYFAVKKAEYHRAHQDETYKLWVEKFPQVQNSKTGDEFLQQGVTLQDGHKTYVILDDFRDSIFMEIGLFIGAVHISLSLFRSIKRHYAGLGWIFAIIGGYLYFPSILGTTSLIQFIHIMSKNSAYQIGFQLFCGGVGTAVLLGFIQNKWAGLIEITKLIELFADILSYLRLYALGLAGMILATTFNQMGKEVGFAAGFFIILMGHGINIVVGIMGGVIHGLRLNFIEWYHHCFEGGGKLFNPLKLLKVKGE